MVPPFGIFLLSTAFYSALAVRILFYLERTRSPLGRLWQGKALIRTIDVINLVNATVASLLSTWVLLCAGRVEVTNISGRLGEYNELAGWTVEAVCGYMVVELGLFLVSSYRLPDYSWDCVMEDFREMAVFHVVALSGLASVLIMDTGYTVAMWVIWSEVASVFLGLEQEFHYSSKIPKRYKEYFSLPLDIICTVSMVLHRGVVFLYLLGLCVVQFTFEATFVCQLSILSVGTILNIYFVICQVRETVRLIMKPKSKYH